MPTIARLVLLLACLALTTGTRAGLPPPLAEGGVPTLAPVLELVTPAVVNIAVLTNGGQQSPQLSQEFRRFFGTPERTRPQLSAGSGVIVDAQKGLVLTNHHVIKDSQKILVTLKDGRRLAAQLIGSDAGTDVALLSVEPAGLTAVRFADSDQIRVGDYVLAIGNPFGLGQTVTSGIVSALGRTGLNIEGYEDFVQTDASINPGNSGGALINLRGELVGINTAIIGPSGGNVGIGFAVPSNMVRAVMNQLAKYGEVRRGRLGLTTQDVTPELAATLGLRIGEGAAVVEVAPGAPAERAGLRRNDLVLALNARRVRSSSDLRNQIGLVPVGEEVELKVRRGGQDLVLRARVAPIQMAVGARGSAVVPELAGASVGNVERDGRPEAVIVVAVQRASAAWAHGLREGDVILAVNGSKMHNTREFLLALREEGNLVLSIGRGDYSFAVAIRR